MEIMLQKFMKLDLILRTVNLFYISMISLNYSDKLIDIWKYFLNLAHLIDAHSLPCRENEKMRSLMTEEFEDYVLLL